MSLRTRITWILVLITALIIAVLYAVSESIFLSNYQVFEQTEIQQKVQQTLNTIENKKNALQSIGGDWAYWDDTYQFAQGSNPEYIENNLDVASLVTLNVNLMAFFDSSGQLIYAKAIDLEQQQEIPLGNTILQALEKATRLITSDASETTPAGFINTPDYSILISAHPILKSSLEGPRAGTLIVGLLVNEAFIQEVNHVTGLNIEFRRTDLELPPDYQEAYSYLLRHKEAFVKPVQPLNRFMPPQQIAGYQLIPNLYGNPALILRTLGTRSIFNQGASTVRNFGYFILVAGLLFGGFTFWFLEQFVLSRIMRLHKGVNEIRTTHNYTVRIPVGGDDEIAELGYSINMMIKGLEEFQFNLIKSDREFRDMLHNLELVAIIRDRNGMITFCNDYLLQLTGWQRTELVGKRWADRFVEPHRREEDFSSYIESIQKNQISSHSEEVIISRWNEKRTIAWNHSILRDQDGKISGIASIGEDITERKQADDKLRQSYEQTQLHLARLTALRKIDLAIASDIRLQDKMQTILKLVRESLHANGVDILLIDKRINGLYPAAADGLPLSSYNANGHFKKETSPVSIALQENRIICIHELQTSDFFDWFLDRFQHELPFKAYAVVPLITNGEIKGVMEAFGGQEICQEQGWKEHFRSLALQTAIALDNAELFDRMEQANSELAQANEATIIGWSKALELRDKETKGHSERVTELALKLAGRCGITGKDVEAMRLGVLLHDIGKMGVPDSILLKPGPLTEEEWVIMRQHPSYAYELLHDIPYLIPSLDVPYCHHERWDGNGYPNGLKGEEIPLAARVFSVIDVWDALTSHRPYRPAWPQAEALRYIREQSGIQFDPQVVERFLLMMEELGKVSETNQEAGRSIVIE